MITISNLSKGFEDSDLQVLDNISFSIEKGEFISIVGPSGCGKTTLLRCIANLEQFSQGVIEMANPELTTNFVFQKPNLLDWRTVGENISLLQELLHTENRNLDMLQLVGLENFEDYFPKQLSGGMQQKVAIARALSTNPDVVLMDEPFAAIDELNRESLNLQLLDILEKTGKTILFVTHNVEEAVFLSDKVIVLSERPARIKEIVNIGLKRPRKIDDKYTKIFQGHVKCIRKILAE